MKILRFQLIQLKKSLQIFNENFDDLVNTIKNNRRNNTIHQNIKIEKEKLIRSHTQFDNNSEYTKEKKDEKIKKLQKLKSSNITTNNNLILKKNFRKKFTR